MDETTQKSRMDFKKKLVMLLIIAAVYAYKSLVSNSIKIANVPKKEAMATR